MSLNLSKSVLVNNICDLQNAILNAKNGDTYILKSGIYNDVILNIACNGVTIQAQNNKVTFSGKTQINITGTNNNFIGFIFDKMNQPTETIYLYGSSNKLVNCQFLNYNFVHAHIVNIQGQYHRVTGCLFKNITQTGLCIFIYRPDPIENYILIDNNKFIDRFTVKNAVNELEIIRIGTSDQSLSSSKTMIINNYLENCCGEIEAISIKSGNNLIIGNSLINSCSSFTLRHGNNSILYKNLIDGKNRLNSAGIRVTAENHLVYDNILMNINSSDLVTIPICINNGQNKPALNGYYTCKNCIIKNNTIWNCNTIFGIGLQIKSNAVNKPVNLLVENNSCYTLENCEVFKTNHKIQYNNDILFKHNNLFACKLGNFTQKLDIPLNQCNKTYIPDTTKYGSNYIIDCNITDNKVFYQYLQNMITKECL
jgi:poly(beta-D-mannuronate) lyase